EVKTTRKVLKKRYGAAPCFADLARDLAENRNGYLREWWQEFTKGWEPMAEEAVRNSLLAHYSSDKAKRLYGVWLGINTLGRSEYATFFRVSRDTMRR
ncbi:MAG: hypothetical protein C4321_02875, partial [Chloroflexota bacterium]